MIHTTQPVTLVIHSMFATYSRQTKYSTLSHRQNKHTMTTADMANSSKVLHLEEERKAKLGAIAQLHSMLYRRHHHLT